MSGTALARALEQHATTITSALSAESAQIKALRDYNDEARRHDPSKIAWSTTLPIELALKTGTPQELRVEYGYTEEEWDALRYNPVFIAELTAACELVKQEGASFKLKARLQAEQLLETGWILIHSPNSEVPPAVKEKLMAGVYRMAGFDNKEGVTGAATGFAIQINFSGGKSHGEAVIEAG